MLLPFETVLRRGVVFLWQSFSQLDDPNIASKDKYIVILSASPLDDPILYVLTNSAKGKHTSLPFAKDLLRIPAGDYQFFPVETIIDAGDAGEYEIDRESLRSVYQSGQVKYKGCLTDDDVAHLIRKIEASQRVARRVKQILCGS